VQTIDTIESRIDAVGSTEQPQAAQSEVQHWKRMLDIFCIVLASPILVPLGLLVGLLIKIVSPGPAIFKQERVGKGGGRFMCLKFRTMVVNADTAVHQGHLTQLISSNRPMTKLDSAGDPRLIRWGHILRSSGLDELPQILNVLRGEMSLVGPRPCVPYEYERYLPRHRRRCDALPGLTGLWQVSGKNKTTFEEMIDLDIHYAGHHSLWLDVKIIALTIPAILVQVYESKRAQRRARSNAIPPGLACRTSEQQQ
jgi:lipopolysaccharide/colanic/teichoic acid biosynthesis glycosyltransferase